MSANHLELVKQVAQQLEPIIEKKMILNILRSN